MRAIILCLAGLLALTAPGAAPSGERPTEADAPDAARLAVVASFDALPVRAALTDQPARLAAAVTALPVHPAGAETPVLTIGGSGFQAIFDREARQAASVLGARDHGPALVLSNTPAQVTGGLLASPQTVALALAALGRRARPGDTLIVYLASHGGRDANIAMDAPRLDFDDLTATDLARGLDRAGIRRRIVIVSACFGASWIGALANPTTIVIAAAAANRTSFGCDDSRTLTVFGDAMLRELARPQSLAAAFAAAKRRVSAVERAEGDTPSLPQAWVGRDMTRLWTAAPGAPK